MSDWVTWLVTAALILLGLFAILTAAFFAVIHYYYRLHFGPQIIRIFEERPLFIIPRGSPVSGAEDVSFAAAGGLQLRGCYLRAKGPRKGLILFGLEFGSNRWAAVQYCSSLVQAGYDVFAYEPRNQGDSDKDAGYEPLQWVTDRDLADLRSAIAYLKSRPDAPTQGIGVFGISKGGSVALVEAAGDKWVRCIATDGAYATYTTVVPYMRRWVSIYSPRKKLQELMPNWVYGRIGLSCMAESASKRQVRFLSIEQAIRRLRQPLFMIHGGADNYIKPEMAEALYRRAGTRHKSLWMVPGAKHNQAAHIAGEEYHRKLVTFFDEYLAPPEPTRLPSAAPPPAEELVVAGAK